MSIQTNIRSNGNGQHQFEGWLAIDDGSDFTGEEFTIKVDFDRHCAHVRLMYLNEAGAAGEAIGFDHVPATSQVVQRDHLLLILPTNPRLPVGVVVYSRESVYGYGDRAHSLTDEEFTELANTLARLVAENKEEYVLNAYGQLVDEAFEIGLAVNRAQEELENPARLLELMESSPSRLRSWAENHGVNVPTVRSVARACRDFADTAAKALNPASR